MAVNINVSFTDYTVDAHKQPFTLAPGETNSNTTSLLLTGQGTPNYSQSINNNFVHLLENFAGPTPPPHATVGQIWYNSTAKEVQVLTNISMAGSARSETWIPVSSNIHIATTPPTYTSRLWYDTTDALASNHQLKIYNQLSASWQPVTKQWMVVGATAPTNNTVLWYNTSHADSTKHEVYVYNTARALWVPVVSHDAAMLTGTVPDARLTTSNIGGNVATSTLAAAATKLNTARTISFSGAVVTASATFDGTANIGFNVTQLDANALTAGTVPIAQLGSSGTRASGFYLAGNNTWTAMPYIPDAYTKTESNGLLAVKLNRDSITQAGFASNDVNFPFFRRESDNGVYYLQPRLGYTPQPLLGYTPAAVSSTLGGYGITNAYTKAEVDWLLGNSASVLQPNGDNFRFLAGTRSMTLPAGGTWCYQVMGYWLSGEGYTATGGVAAGGTVIASGWPGSIYGFAWRWKW